MARNEVRPMERRNLMTKGLKRLLLAAPLALVAFTGCDDDGGGNDVGDAAVDGPVADAGKSDVPAAETGSGGTGGGADGGVSDGGGDTAPINAACAPTDPNVYPAAGFEANTTAEKQILMKIAMLNTAMAEAETDLTKSVTKAQLDALYGAGANSLKTVTSGYYAGQIEGDTGLLAQYASASGDKVFAPGTGEGLGGNWVFNANGLDLRQQVEKGLMSSAQYKHMADISRQATVTPADVDRMLAVMGGEPAFPYDTTNDKSVAKYASRRSNRADLNNLYLTIKNASIKARAAAANPTVCSAELTAALTDIRESWEKVLVTTTLYYAADTQKKLMTANDLATRSAALHSLGEGIAFVHGFRGLPAQNRIITDAQIDEILVSLFALPAATPITGVNVATPYKYLVDDVQPPRLTTVINKIASVYGFTPAQVMSLVVNHPTM